LPKLDYLFAAIFSDGMTIVQTAEDQSALDEKRSAYYDVVKAQEEGARLVSFGLFNQEGNVWSVSLLDGHFELNGVSFAAQPVSSPVIPPGGIFSLIFCRDHQQDFIVSSDGSMEEGEHRMVYRFGWKYSAQKKNWEQTIVIS
jgi:hypothetical protein